MLVESGPLFSSGVEARCMESLPLPLLSSLRDLDRDRAGNPGNKLPGYCLPSLTGLKPE